ncbi:MAG: U32 family peptidase, partial [Lachnospiraceae bacterium]|nr:U32 family peptidase [Lachnospiraceae bacterium]
MELLAPAKNLTSAKAVFSCGADAVYFGGKKFGARAYADNFDENEILSLIDYAHIFGKRAYMTVNTLLKDAELERMLYQTIEPLYRHGLDAVLVQDFGVFSFLRQHFPELPIHTSTQMNVTSRHGAALLKNAGASRIVLARELSIAEMAAIHEAVDVEFEVFVHGALCVCYSGQCLMSSMIGGRSGNRGACGQACRLAYEVKDAKEKTVKAPGAYPLSPKDLCGIDDLYALKKAGVASLKIEGRMKSLSYAATVTEVYREYIDRSDEAQYFVEEKDRRRLLDAGNRNGFTNAYYYRRNDTAMMAYTNSAHKRSAEEEPQLTPLKLPVSAKVSVLAGAPLSVSFYAAESVPNVANVGESHGATPLAAARTKPTSEADIISKLQKTGDYPFVLTEVTVDGADTSF